MSSLKKIFKEAIEEPEKAVSSEDKRKLLFSMKKFNEYAKSIYRENNISDLGKEISDIAGIAEAITMEKQNDWFDAITVKRDMRSLKESAKMFEATCKEISQLQHRLESCYEDVSSKLHKYFGNDDEERTPEPVADIRENKRRINEETKYDEIKKALGPLANKVKNITEKNSNVTVTITGPFISAAIFNKVDAALSRIGYEIIQINPAKGEIDFVMIKKW